MMRIGLLNLTCTITAQGKVRTHTYSGVARGAGGGGICPRAPPGGGGGQNPDKEEFLKFI